LRPPFLNSRDDGNQNLLAIANALKENKGLVDLDLVHRLTLLHLLLVRSVRRVLNPNQGSSIEIEIAVHLVRGTQHPRKMSDKVSIYPYG
jgi:hypothetical protein